MSIETSNITPDNPKIQSLIFLRRFLSCLFAIKGKFLEILESKSSIEKLTLEAVAVFAGADGNSYLSMPFNADFFNNNPKFKALLLLDVDELEHDSGASNVKGYILKMQNDVRFELYKIFKDDSDGYEQAIIVAQSNNPMSNMTLQNQRGQLEASFKHSIQESS